MDFDRCRYLRDVYFSMARALGKFCGSIGIEFSAWNLVCGGLQSGKNVGRGAAVVGLAIDAR